MTRKICIVGCGFAGVWSALAAKRLIKLKGKEKDIEVIVIAPQAALVLRPRLYEADVASMVQSLDSLFEATGTKLIQGVVETILYKDHRILIGSANGVTSEIGYDRLILAAGSSIIRPASVDGLDEHAFSIDNIESASELERHLHQLSSQDPCPARNTVVVCGAGFTGIELAAELPTRLNSIFKDGDNPRIVLVGNSEHIGPELGPGPRPVILKALQDLGVECKLGSAVAAIRPGAVILASGEHIESKTAIWTAGVRATPLTQQIPGLKDSLGRLIVDENLRVPEVKDIFVTGDAARAATRKDGPCALMSCQHALALGRSSGHNAAADLLGEPALPYCQSMYATCLDLGSWGAVLTEGWDREVRLSGAKAKKIKNYINRTEIYVPKDGDTALKAADPAFFQNRQVPGPDVEST